MYYKLISHDIDIKEIQVKKTFSLLFTVYIVYGENRRTRTVAFNIALSFIHFTRHMLTYVCKYTSSLYTY